jgi:hypothetical protein
MRRLTLTLAVAALLVTFAATGTFANFTQTQPNSASVGAAASFLPVNTAAPLASGTVLPGNTLTAAAGTWGYTHAIGESVDTSGEQTISTTRQWQFCIAGTCLNLPGATGATLLINPAVVTAVGGGLAGVSFRVQETATNAIGSATPVPSNAVS